MMKFFNEDFLLNNSIARTLYIEGLKDTPIFDYHCHISAKEVFEDYAFEDIGDLWLKDHYKWRLMRSCGIEEKLITGSDTSNYEKFTAWARVLPHCIGNVIYTWSQLELLRCFGINETLSEKSAERIWNTTKEMLSENGFTPRNLLKRAGVAMLNTTDDPLDTLDYHRRLAEDAGFSVEILPAWRPDKLLLGGNGDYGSYIDSLGDMTGVPIGSFEDLKKALRIRMDYFGSHGCVAADHSLRYVPFKPCKASETEEIFNRKVSGEEVSPVEEDCYVTALLQFLAREYKRRKWVMELHMGVMRNTNTRMYEQLGPDSGYDSVYDSNIAESLSMFLNSLEYTNELPKTILFSLNPKDYYAIGSIMGSFQSEEAPGKVQFGTAWWFNDHIDGIKKQLRTLANLAVLTNFTGMVTDSRCYLSAFSRHEIFRRLLCSTIGEWVESGQYPEDEARLLGMVRDIAFNNARNYFRK